MATGKKFLQGYYTPKNPEKYLGDVSKIVYRSSWELEVHRFLDNNSKVIKWGSEEIAIPYIKPTDGKVHKYFPDYIVCYRNRTGETVWELLEVKPKEQTKKSSSRNPKTRLYENVTYAINMSKWRYAQAWCEEQTQKTGIIHKFRILTQMSIFK